MRKICLSVLPALILCLFLFAACQKDDKGKDENPVAGEITVRPADAEFDVRDGADIVFSVNLRGQAFVSLKEGEAGVPSDGYILSADKLTFKSAYLLTLSLEKHIYTLSTADKSCQFSITARDTRQEAPAAQVTRKTFNFEDIVFEINYNGGTFTGLTKEGSAVGGANYAYTATAFTLKMEYLETLSVGTHTFKLATDGGELELTVVVAAQKSVWADNERLKLYAGGDVSFALDLRGNTISSLTLNGAAVGNSNYGYSDTNCRLTVGGAYLSTLGKGINSFTLTDSLGGGFNFGIGVDITAGDILEYRPQAARHINQTPPIYSQTNGLNLGKGTYRMTFGMDLHSVKNDRALNILFYLSYDEARDIAYVSVYRSAGTNFGTPPGGLRDGDLYISFIDAAAGANVTKGADGKWYFTCEFTASGQNSLEALFGFIETSESTIDNFTFARIFDPSVLTGAAMKIHAGGDAAFGVNLKGGTVTAVTLDGAALAAGSQYTYSAGTLTIKAAYLDTLAKGLHTFTLTDSRGSQLYFAVGVDITEDDILEYGPQAARHINQKPPIYSQTSGLALGTGVYRMTFGFDLHSVENDRALNILFYLNYAAGRDIAYVSVYRSAGTNFGTPPGGLQNGDLYISALGTNASADITRGADGKWYFTCEFTASNQQSLEALFGFIETSESTVYNFALVRILNTSVMKIYGGGDVSFGVNLKSNTVSTITRNGAALAGGADYTYSAGTLTIKAAYLDTLAKGLQTFILTDSQGNTFNFGVGVDIAEDDILEYRSFASLHTDQAPPIYSQTSGLNLGTGTYRMTFGMDLHSVENDRTLNILFYLNYAAGLDIAYVSVYRSAGTNFGTPPGGLQNGDLYISALGTNASADITRGADGKWYFTCEFTASGQNSLEALFGFIAVSSSTVDNFALVKTGTAYAEHAKQYGTDR